MVLCGHVAGYIARKQEYQHNISIFVQNILIFIRQTIQNNVIIVFAQIAILTRVAQLTQMAQLD